MAEGKRLFNIELTKIQELLSHNKWFNLQEEFKIKGISLSQSLLVWEEEQGDTWLIADFENQKTYDIEWAEGEVGNLMIGVWERSSEAEQPVTFEATELIRDHLKRAQGTTQGIIDSLRKLNLDEINLERLKRSDLSGAGFSFEPVHQDLAVVHSMFLEILTAPRESLLNLSRGQVESLKGYLPEFYENVQKIEDFEISGENPRETYTNLLQDISNFCDSAKGALRHIVVYLSSGKVEQLNAEIRLTVDTAVDKLEVETNRAEENNNEVENQRKEIRQEFDRLKIEVENKLAEKPISQYKTIFADQAKEYYKEAQNWLWISIGTTAVFFGAFYLLPTLLESGGPGWTEILQNLLAKGFLLSPIYLWLNRSIKNYTAQKHLEVINTHRQNALETFDTFVAAAGDNRETRDAVLLSATEAIFDANQTGYLSTKGSGADSRSPVQQVIKEIIPDRSSPKS